MFLNNYILLIKDTHFARSINLTGNLLAGPFSGLNNFSIAQFCGIIGLFSVMIIYLNESHSFAIRACIKIVMLLCQRCQGVKDVRSAFNS